MATVREYGYYFKGLNLAIVEKDTNFDNDVNSKDYGPGSDRAQWKSPLASVTDGLQLQYSYAPNYFIESTDSVTSTVSGWDQDNDGNFRLRATGGTDWTSSPNLSNVSYIVLKKAGKFNGLHKVSSVTNNRIVTTTKISASTSETLFEETVILYYDVSTIIDESSEINIPDYLAKGIVYYVKAKLAEEANQMDARGFYLKEFSKVIEKFENKRIAGPRKISSGPFAIR